MLDPLIHGKLDQGRGVVLPVLIYALTPRPAPWSWKRMEALYNHEIVVLGVHRSTSAPCCGTPSPNKTQGFEVLSI